MLNDKHHCAIIGLPNEGVKLESLLCLVNNFIKRVLQRYKNKLVKLKSFTIRGDVCEYFRSIFYQHLDF